MDSSRYKELESWAGGPCCVAEVSVFAPAGHRGLRCMQAVPPLAPVLRVPMRCVLAGEHLTPGVRAATASVLGDGVASDELDATLAVLCLLKALVDGPASPFAPYVDTLPALDQLSNVWLRPSLVARLAGTELHAAASAHRAAIEQVHGRLMAALPLSDFPADRITMDQWLWACACMESRAMKIRVRGAERVLLVPLGDMANHAFGTAVNMPSLRHLEAEGGGGGGGGGSDTAGDDHIVFSAGPGGVAAGDELFLCYGPELTNSHLMLHYGFAVADNANDRVTIELTPPAEEPGFRDTKVGRREKIGAIN